MFLPNMPYNTQRAQLFEIVGRVDSDSAGVVADAIEQAIKTGRDQIFLDLSAVEYMNSGGLRELVKAFKLVQRASGSMVLVNPSDYVCKLLELVGLETIFEIHMDPLWDAGRLTPGDLPPVPRQMFYHA